MTIDLDYLEHMAKHASDSEASKQKYINSLSPLHMLELLRRLRTADEDRQRADRRADFYQERAAAGLAALEDVARAICRTSLPIVEQQPLLAIIGQAQRAHGEAGEALMNRLRAAEAIVRDLAACDERTFEVQADSGNPACVMCNWGRDGSNEGRCHAESCPYRRAVEAQR